jgi:NAD(P)-dependent dehydrogenase (short-subunit alcohol dehydrogenase family)
LNEERSPAAPAAPPLILITGSAAGIGAACARWFAQAGWTVLGIDQADVALPPDLGGSHIALTGTVEGAEVWRRAENHIKGHSGLDAMVNNAAIQLEKPLLETTVAEFEHVMAVNVTGIFRGLQLADALMRDGGSIVNMASVLGYTADPVLGAYSTSKGAVVQLTRNAALAFASRRIRVNAVCPGAVATPLTTRVWDLTGDPHQARHQMELLYPLRRIAEPPDIAEVVAFLVSPASKSMTGSLLVADGGLTATNAEYALTGEIT